MEYINYSIKQKKGCFYAISKTPKDGYSENTYTDRESKKEITNYHKEVKTIQGKLIKFGTKSTDFGERVFLMFETGEDEITSLEFPLFRSGTSVNDYAKSFCQYVDNLVLQEDTKVFLNYKNKDNKGYLYKNMFFSQDGEKVNWAFSSFGEDSPVPSPTKGVHPVTKKETWNYDAVDAFYYEKLKSINMEEQANSEEAPKQEKAPVEPKTSPAKAKAAPSETDSVTNDDLPF